MSWKLKYAPRVRKYYKTLDKHILRRLKSCAERLQKRPRLGSSLSGTSEPTRSLRCGTPGGEFRIVYVLIEADEAIFIFHVEKREGDYEDLERKYNL